MTNANQKQMRPTHCIVGDWHSDLPTTTRKRFNAAIVRNFLTLMVFYHIEIMQVKAISRNAVSRLFSD